MAKRYDRPGEKRPLGWLESEREVSTGRDWPEASQSRRDRRGGVGATRLRERIGRREDDGSSSGSYKECDGHTLNCEPGDSTGEKTGVKDGRRRGGESACAVPEWLACRPGHMFAACNWLVSLAYFWGAVMTSFYGCWTSCRRQNWVS